MVYSFDDAKAPGRRRTQYFEMFINRGIYHDGWWAASRVEHSLGRRRRAGRSRHGEVGAVQPRRGLLAGERPGGEKPGEAAAAAGPVVDRGGPLQRAAARRPQDGAAQRRAAGPAVADRRAHVVHLLPGHRWRCRRAARRTCSTSRSRSPPTSRCRRGEERRRDLRDRRQRRRLRALRARRPPGVRRQLPEPIADARDVEGSRCRRARRRSAANSPTTAAAWARAAR